jgi:hypothetical protein
VAAIFRGTCTAMTRLGASVSTPNILIGDRSNATASRSNPGGNCRPDRGPLNAYELIVGLDVAT